ncbi:protein-L-isoaspartate(D-aspartate) O-methyltransferase [Thiohalobacter sp.]|uniref:protein-L-isoaspartate(D-aspartate) O-methyltransferase n=1 Tax=Thiohalobacter sp. TaxID=2025948 RepID=UPI00262506C2|nr:protein-L-isoaspartate(D-aspartate) O-methyltransferase [Thiohalobacter sp.]
MLNTIEREIKQTRDLIGLDGLSDAVREALRRTPRERFVPDGLKTLAYADQPLPIGNGQTISQPYIVAIMTQLLDPRPEHRVLEVGTGSGYQTAVLGRLAGEVYSVEVIEALAREAAKRLAALGLDNVRTRVADGHIGWPEAAPFDRIMVTAAAPAVPEALIEQLRPGGRLIAPLGDGLGQVLTRIDKGEDGQLTEHALLPVMFVPLTHGPAGERD